MRASEPGHIYSLQRYDLESLPPSEEPLIFMKRVGEGYPGNEHSPHSGTNCQEVLRVLIDRVNYLNEQNPCSQNKAILHHLRTALFLFEYRAAERKGKLRELHQLPGFRADLSGIENIPTCEICGHIFPHEEH